MIDEFTWHHIGVNIKQEVNRVRFTAKRIDIYIPFGTAFLTDNLSSIQHGCGKTPATIFGDSHQMIFYVV